MTLMTLYGRVHLVPSAPWAVGASTSPVGEREKRDERFGFPTPLDFAGMRLANAETASTELLSVLLVKRLGRETFSSWLNFLLARR